MQDIFKILRSAVFSKLNREMEGVSVEVPLHVTSEKEEIGRYCRATLDSAEKYMTEKNEVPPFYFSRFIFNEMKKILMDRRLKVNFFKMVHAWQEIEFADMKKISSVDSVRFNVKNIRDCRSGESFEIETVCLSGKSEVLKSVSGFIVRTGRKSSSSMTGIEKDVYEGDFKEAEIQTYPGQERDYAEISEDRNLIHTNSFAAKLAGFRGTILHGLCTMTCVSNCLVSMLLKDDWRKMKSVGCRFSSPVYAGEQLSLFYGKVKGNAYEFHVKNRKGKTVLKNGEFRF